MPELTKPKILLRFEPSKRTGVDAEGVSQQICRLTGWRYSSARNSSLTGWPIDDGFDHKIAHTLDQKNEDENDDEDEDDWGSGESKQESHRVEITDLHTALRKCSHVL